MFLLALAHPAHDVAANAAAAHAWSRWAFEPGVVVSLLVFGAMYVAGVLRLWRFAGRGKGIAFSRAALFGLGWLTLVAALVSPIDTLSDELLSVHMVQHELLMVVAAPLIAISSPLVAIMWLFRRR